MIKKSFQYWLLAMTILTSCKEKGGSLSVQEFGNVDGKQVNLYNIEFPGKLEASVTNYGGIITHLKVPDKSGEMEDIVLGYDNLQGYLTETPYFGALIGRYGNRIANGRFILDSVAYELAKNNGPNHLHGGLKSFDKVVWTVVDSVITKDKVSLTLRYVSPDGEEGYPGTLTTSVTYAFAENELQVHYESTTDKTTVVNLTQHTYFNLSGDLDGGILDHELTVN